LLLEVKASPSMVGFPLLLIPLAICNIIVFLMPGLSFSAPLVTLPLISGAAWVVTSSDVLLTLGILMLLFEVIKGARPGAKYFTDHLLSLVVFGGAAAEFLLLPRFGTSTYFLLTTLALVDFVSGIVLRTQRSRGASVAIASARSSAASSPAEVVRAPVEAPPEPHFEPPAAPSIPTAEPIVAPAAPPEPGFDPPAAPSTRLAEPTIETAPPVPVEAAPPERVEPDTADADVVAHEPSPEIQSPDVQPGSGTSPSPDHPER
jgi:hypothetical protein